MHTLLGFYEQSNSFALKEIPKAPTPYNLRCGPIVQSTVQTESFLNKCTAVASPLEVRQSFCLPLHDPFGADWIATKAVRQVARNTSWDTHFSIILTSLAGIATALTETETCKTAFVSSYCLRCSFWTGDHIYHTCIFPSSWYNVKRLSQNHIWKWTDETE